MSKHNLLFKLTITIACLQNHIFTSNANVTTLTLGPTTHIPITPSTVERFNDGASSAVMAGTAASLILDPAGSYSTEAACFYFIPFHLLNKYQQINPENAHMAQLGLTVLWGIYSVSHAFKLRQELANLRTQAATNKRGQ